MTARQRVTAAALLAGVVVALTGGCSVNDKQSCEAQTLDLREPPTREAIGIPPGESEAIWPCDDVLDVTIRLPEDRVIEVATRLLAADSHRAEDRENGDPTTIDVHSISLSIDDAADLAEQIADTLGMDPSQIETWRQEARNPPDPTLDTRTFFIPGSAGYVNADLQVIHQSGEEEEDNRNNVHLILYLAGTSS